MAVAAARDPEAARVPVVTADLQETALARDPEAALHPYSAFATDSTIRLVKSFKNLVPQAKPVRWSIPASRTD
jgi:hypothetical protein